MNPLPTEVSTSVSVKLVESLIESSVLLLPETKAALLSYLQNSNDPDEFTRIIDFLRNEKSFILKFMTRRLHEGNFPEKIPALLQEMQSKFLRGLRTRERLEVESEKIGNTFELAFAF